MAKALGLATALERALTVELLLVQSWGLRQSLGFTEEVTIVWTGVADDQACKLGIVRKLCWVLGQTTPFK